MHKIGGRVKQALADALDRAEIPAKVVGNGVLFDVYFTEHDIVDYRSTLLADKAKLGQFNLLLRERGVLKGDSKFYLSTEHDEADVDVTIAAIDSAVDELSA
jgi:glutamate-1-semialdehyde 2,1-aminomutase